MTKDDLSPRWVLPRIKSAPKIRSVYWCQFPTDAHLPEMWKVRQVVVISYRNQLRGAVTIIPISTSPQDENEWAVRIPGINDQKARWAICDKPGTVATSRLLPEKGNIPRVSPEVFNAIVAKVLEWLPKAQSGC